MSADAIYRQHLELVRALGNPVPKPVADALAQQWRHFDQTAAILPYARPPNLVPHELEQAPQQKPLARGV
jgi:hypothetical protein